MTAKLAAIAGPAKGQIFPLPDGEFSIGRDQNNSLPLMDPAVSRRHCVIEGDRNRFRIRDLGTVNRTFVNDLPVTEQLLGPGDQVKVGGSCLLVVFETDRLTSEGQAETDELRLSENSTLTLRSESAHYGRPESIADKVPQSERTSRHLKSLIKIAVDLPRRQGLDRLAPGLLEAMLEAMPAQRAALLLGPGSDEFTRAYYRWREAGEEPFVISTTLATRVLEDRISVLSGDAAHPLPDLPSKSLPAIQVQSLIAAPLIAGEEVLGLIYVDTRDPLSRFGEGDLQLLTGIAGIAGPVLRNALDLSSLQQEKHRLQAELASRHNIIGDSPRMIQVCALIVKVAPGTSTILIRGETGTGKEVVARAIHHISPRAARPFVAINCAAIPENLLESELLGHEKGAFTGAAARKKGKIEEADGGTLFLDEIGEMPLPFQTKLLRVIQEREFERVGSTHTMKVDIRVIAATNRDLEDAVRCGVFREDLFYRLNVISLTMPPLRERSEDILPLARHFLERDRAKMARRITGFSTEAEACLTRYHWPGNVRELENALERAIVLGSTAQILPEDLPDAVAEASVAPPHHGAVAGGFHASVKDAKRQLVRGAIEQANGSYAEAARLLGMHPNNLHRLIRELGLRGEIRSAAR